MLGVTLLAPCGAASPRDVMRAADAFRGFARPYRFLAAVERQPSRNGREAASRGRERTMVVEVRSNGFARQLVLVRAPRRGDALLKVGDEVWLRPRQLHRLTRIPPELRVFGGAAISDVAAADLAHGYDATIHAGSCEDTSDYVLELTATAQRMRYPRVRYRVDCRTREPRRIDFMTADGRILKTVRYERFERVLGTRIGTEFTIEDHIFRDTWVVRMSSFAFLGDAEPEYTPGYLLSLPPGMD